MSENTETATTCKCTEAFGQPLWSADCNAHEQCPEFMRGVPIRCILASGHIGAHK